MSGAGRHAETSRNDIWQHDRRLVILPMRGGNFDLLIRVIFLYLMDQMGNAKTQ